MSTSNTHQQSLADVGYETRPLMLERGSYIPWASRFRRYLNRKRENKKWINKAIDEGPYEFRIFTPSDTEAQRMKKEEDLRGDDLKHYEAMNLILISIPNDIYNSVDACKTAKAMWQRVERLMRGTVQNKVDRETRFNNKFDQFVAEPGEALVSVYNRFAQLIMIWKEMTSYSQTSLVKKVEKSHDPLTLVAHTGFSSRTTTPYYVTHPSLVVDYDEDYQGDAVPNNSEDSLTSAMILLARAITQRFSNLTNNRLRTSSNTRNQAIVQELFELRLQELHQMFNATTVMRKDEAGVILTDEQNDFLFADASPMEEIEILSANICLMARIQPANFDYNKGPNYDSAFLSELQTPSTSYVNPLFAKDTQEQKYPKQSKITNNIIESYALEQLARNAYKKAEKQQIIAKKVQQQNIVLTKQLDSYKEKVRVFEMNKGNNTTYFNEYIEADQKAKKFEQESQSQFIHDRDVIRDLEQQRDKLELSVVELKRQTMELQKTQSIFKHKMSENEDKYHDIVLDLEARAIKEMKNIFVLTENDLSETWKQNELLKDQLLEAKLKHEIECCVLLSHECVDNEMHDEIEKIQRDSIEIQEGMQK
ncbi:hypothetical protein Tco_0138045 [Tanacetum coccineum]